jgi:epsilon-lactone hydrolase
VLRLSWITLAIVLSPLHATAQTLVPGQRELLARTIPVPDTVSPEIQRQIAAPLPPAWNVSPKTTEEWKAQVDAAAAAVVQSLPALREELHVKVEPPTIDGLRAYAVTPESIPPENRNRLLVHVHGATESLRLPNLVPTGTWFRPYTPDLNVRGLR